MEENHTIKIVYWIIEKTIKHACEDVDIHTHIYIYIYINK